LRKKVEFNSVRNRKSSDLIKSLKRLGESLDNLPVVRFNSRIKEEYVIVEELKEGRSEKKKKKEDSMK
jgi:hypothetical protein